MIPDGELLRRYAEEGSEASFSEIVNRHANFVHAVAMRRGNGDSHLAADVTQKVFIAVAKNARTLARHAALSSWLYTSTRNAVLDAIRAERRRTEREKEAMMMYEIDSAHEEIVDERLFAEVDKLNARDRDAVVMRFFNEWSFGRIAEALLISEDAARMRVERALSKLRVGLARNGMPSTAAALAATLGNNAGLGAPAGLTAQITQAALAAGAVTAPVATGGLLALLAEAKATPALTGAGILLLLGAAEYQSQQADDLRASLAQVLIEQSALNARIGAIQEAPVLVQPVATPIGAPTGGTSGDMSASGRPPTTPNDSVAILKARLAATPEMQIPELTLLGDRHWSIAAGNFPPTRESAFPAAFRTLRDSARTRFANLGVAALQKYAEANNGNLPTRIADLQPYFAEPISQEILSRYVMIRTGRLSDLRLNEAAIGEIASAQDNAEGDSALRFGSALQSIRLVGGSAFSLKVQHAVHIHMSQNGGQRPVSSNDLTQYFSTDQLQDVEKQLERAQY